jgi:hypothetical protein
MAGAPKTALNRRASGAKTAGLSGGTGFTGLVLLIPDNGGFHILRSILFVLAPTITLFISSFWDVLVREIDIRVVDWRIRSEKKRAEIRYRSLDPAVSPEVRERAKKDLEALTLLEFEISKRRVETIVVRTSRT